MVACHHCGKIVDIADRIGRNDSCPHCSSDLHVCYNCRHYDPQSYNECRETQAERVLDKDRANFCDFFVPRSEKLVKAVPRSREEQAKAKLDSLFKK